jgi:hypothetical protein
MHTAVEKYICTRLLGSVEFETQLVNKMLLFKSIWPYEMEQNETLCPDSRFLFCPLGRNETPGLNLAHRGELCLLGVKILYSPICFSKQ